MKRNCIGLVLVAALIVGISAPALAWEKGTHAFIAEQLKKGGSWQTAEGSYGAMAPDMFIYWYVDPYSTYRDFLYEQTHFNAWKVWAEVERGSEKPAAIGFLSHNNVWGADSTAHVRARTTGLTEGYVITKAAILHAMLMQDPGYAALMTGYEDVSLGICHELVEAAGDMILMDLTSQPRSNVQNLMVRAYARDLASFSKGTPYPLTKAEAAQVIREAERQFRDDTSAYAALLNGDVETMRAFNVERYKVLAGVFLAAYGIPVPDEGTLTALVTAALDGASAIAEPDYMTEVLATVDYVRVQLRQHKIR
jgi:hypothetical protein